MYFVGVEERIQLGLQRKCSYVYRGLFQNILLFAQKQGIKVINFDHGLLYLVEAPHLNKTVCTVQTRINARLVPLGCSEVLRSR